MIKRIFLLIMAMVLMTGCAKPESLVKKQYQMTSMDVFDTVTTITGFAGSEEEFMSAAGSIHDKLKKYHQLFDIYNDYEGIANLKTINDQAGIAPVEVDPEIVDLLLDCKKYYELTGGKVNAAMGSVLYLWHEAREESINDPLNTRLPDENELKEAAEHCSFDTVIIDEEASTVYLEDPMQRMDVGAIAKGWATERACENAPSGMAVSVGGNVRTTGPKPEKNTPWYIGVQDPYGKMGENLHTLYINKESVVSSGDYQRYYTVDGKIYHHIIDPETLFPGTKWKAVSIVCEDSGLADALSTALFLLPMEEGQAILDKCNARALWIAPDGEIYYSPGFEELIRT